MKHCIAIIAFCITLSTAFGRTKTSTHRLANVDKEVETIADTIASPAGDTLPSHVTPNAIAIKGYSKKASDGKETFFVTNKSNHRISQIKLLLRYTGLDGKLIHQRLTTVNVALNPGDTQLVAIKSWDLHRQFYYYAGTKPRKSATPFKLSYRLTGYSIPIGE